MILHVSTLQTDWGRLKMRLNMFLFILSHSSTAVTHPPMESKSRMHPRPMRFCLYKSHMGNVLDLQGSHFLVIKKTQNAWPGSAGHVTASGFWSPVRSSILYLLALGYSQKIDPREWREKPLLIWYDAGRREQMGTALGLVLLAVADVGGAG